jgi:hypothetical protein
MTPAATAPATIATVARRTTIVRSFGRRRVGGSSASTGISTGIGVALTRIDRTGSASSSTSDSLDCRGCCRRVAPFRVAAPPSSSSSPVQPTPTPTREPTRRRGPTSTRPDVGPRSFAAAATLGRRSRRHRRRPAHDPPAAWFAWRPGCRFAWFRCQRPTLLDAALASAAGMRAGSVAT